jgi:hypothetical protein
VSFEFSRDDEFINNWNSNQHTQTLRSLKARKQYTSNHGEHEKELEGQMVIIVTRITMMMMTMTMQEH